MVIIMEDIQTQIEELRAKRRSSLQNGEATDKIDELLVTRKSSDKDKINKEKKDDGILGVVTFQGIIAVAIAILYVALMSFSPEQANEIATSVKDRTQNDFSFKDKLYDSVGAFLTYLNTMTPVQEENNPPPNDSTDNTQSALPESSGDNAASSQPPTDDSNNNVASDLNGAGGEFNSADGMAMPTNATFAPLIYTGAITYPITGISKITSQFGFRVNPVLSKPDFHNALDIAAPAGTPILAVADGVVTRSAQDKSLGNFIKIQHANGFSTVYGHCSKLIAKEGMHIRAGEVIALVGSTGDSTGPHVHFGAVKDGLYFNPDYLFSTDNIFNVKDKNAEK